MKNLHKNYIFWLGLVFSVFLMVVLYRKSDLRQLKSIILEMNPIFIAMAILSTFANYFFRAIRWRCLILPIKNISIQPLFSSTIIGYMANNLLPARLGEFVRAYTISNKEQIATAPVLATLVIDRLCEGLVIMLTLVSVLMFVKFPAELQKDLAPIRTGGITIFLTYLAIIAFLAILRMHTARSLRIIAMVLKLFPLRLREKLIALLNSFITGIYISTKVHHLTVIALSTLAIWLLTIIPIDLILRSANISLPFSASIFTMLLIVFAALIPSAPGNIGTFHFACYKGLTAFNVAENTALSVAIVLHATWFFPVTIAGIFYLWKESISLKSFRSITNDK